MLPLSVVIPATNRPATLDRCVAAVQAACGPDDEVIIVDGPRERTAIEARKHGRRPRRHEIVVFVDADVEVHPDALERIRAPSPTRRRPWCSARTTMRPRCRPPSRPPQPAAPPRAPDEPRTHHVVLDRLGAVRRKAFAEVGGFDAVCDPCTVDRGHRPRPAPVERGAAIRLDPAIQGEHLKASAMRSPLWTDRRAWGRVGGVDVAFGSCRGSWNLGLRHWFSAARERRHDGRRRARFAAVLVAGWPRALVHADHSFHAARCRRQGVSRAVVGIGLHALHHLVAAAAVPVGVIARCASGRRASRRGPTGGGVALEPR